MPWWHSAAEHGVVYRHVPTPIFEFAGPRLGANLAAVDIDLDGRDDLAMVAPSSSLDGSSDFLDSYVYVVAGEDVFSGDDEVDPDQRALTILRGPERESNLDGYIAAHGDITGTGYPSFWVSGHSVGLPLEGRWDVDQVADWRFADWGYEGNRRAATPRCGDLNADGFEDYCSSVDGIHFGPHGMDEHFEFDLFFVGEFLRADGFDGNTSYSLIGGRDTDHGGAGAVYIDHPPVTGETDVEIRGFDPGDKVGNWVSTGELTGDGTDDVFVASILDNDVTGRAWIHDNAHESGNLLDSTREFFGLFPRDAFGKASVIADFDGDGFEDLAIGIAGFYGTQNRPGRVAVFAGPIEPGSFTEEDATRTWYGGRNDDDFGAALAVGDFNGDGIPELAIGAPEDNAVQPSGGVVYVLDDPLGRNDD